MACIVYVALLPAGAGGQFGQKAGGGKKRGKAAQPIAPTVSVSMPAPIPQASDWLGQLISSVIGGPVKHEDREKSIATVFSDVFRLKDRAAELDAQVQAQRS